MANKRRILTFTLLIATVGFVSWLILSQPGEPVYQGKPLSFWCAQEYSGNLSPDSNMDLQTQAEIAIRTIGTNAIPTLLRWLRAKDSKFKLKLIQLVQKQHLVRINWNVASARHMEAAMGFYRLGPLGESALPDLIEIYNEHRPDLDYVSISAASIIGYIGPGAADAVPQLVQDTTDTNADIRWSAVRVLGKIHSRPGLAVPALTKTLRDPVHGIRRDSAISLGAFGIDAKSAVPELIKALSDPMFFVKDDAASALKKIDPEAAAKAGVK
jgi:HEAT repeat protein